LFEEKKKSIVKRTLTLAILAVSVGFLISIINAGFDWRTLMFILPISGIAIFFGLKQGLKMKQEAWESYEIIWDKTTIKKSQIRTKDILFG
jgi:hypothetical protein